MFFERSLLESAGVQQFAALLSPGPGAVAIARCVAGLEDSAAPVLLVGVAGGLSARFAPGMACLATAVRSHDDDETFVPPIAVLPGSTAQPCTVCSVDQPVTTIPAKRRLHERCGADIVDTESIGFARACTSRGLRWGIIRGISDGSNEPLPPQLLRCVDETGRPATARAVGAALRNPTLIPIMMRLRRNARRSMIHAAAMLRTVHDDSAMHAG